MTTTIKNKENVGGIYRDKLVMNINNDPAKIALVDRLNLFVVRTKRFRTKSDAMHYLMNRALDSEEAEEERETAAQKKSREDNSKTQNKKEEVTATVPVNN
jgi:Arc/MetJ-type ribon-helix-helix transcriptional regulator